MNGDPTRNWYAPTIDPELPQEVEGLAGEETRLCTRSWWLRKLVISIGLFAVGGLCMAIPNRDWIATIVGGYLLLEATPMFVHAGSQLLLGGELRLRRKYFEHRMPCAYVAFRWTDMSECEVRRFSIFGWTLAEIVVFDVQPRAMARNEWTLLMAAWWLYTRRSMTVEDPFGTTPELLAKRLNAFRERALIEFAPEPGLSDADRGTRPTP